MNDERVSTSRSPYLQLSAEVVCVDLVKHVAVLVLVGVCVLLLRLLLLLFLLLMLLLLLHKLIMLLLPCHDPLLLPGGVGGDGLAGVCPADNGGSLGPQRVAVVLRQGHLKEGVGIADELVDVPLACISVGGKKECIIPG